VVTAGPSVVRVIKQSDFHAFLDRNPEAALAVSRGIGAKLRWATRDRIDNQRQLKAAQLRVDLDAQVDTLAQQLLAQTRARLQPTEDGASRMPSQSSRSS